MNEHQQSKPSMENVQQQLNKFDKRQSEMQEKVDKMYFALMGNELARDGGLVGRIEELEETDKNILKELQELKGKNIGFEIYQKIMWSMVGGVVALVFSYVVNLMFEK